MNACYIEGTLVVGYHFDVVTKGNRGNKITEGSRVYIGTFMIAHRAKADILSDAVPAVCACTEVRLDFGGPRSGVRLRTDAIANHLVRHMVLSSIAQGQFERLAEKS